MIRVPKNLSADQSCSSGGWYAVATKAREDHKVQLNLERQGYRVFSPRLSVKKRRRGHWQVVTEAMFPGYLFVVLELGADDPVPIRSTVGCIGLVRFARAYTPVPVELIEGLLVAARQTGDAESPFEPENQVYFVSGPFAGIEALCSAQKSVDWGQSGEAHNRVGRRRIKYSELL